MILILLALLAGPPDLPLALADEEIQQEDDPLPRPDRTLRPLGRPLEPERPDSFVVHATLELRALRGRTRVREDDSVPDRLTLGGDLEFGPAAGVHLLFAKDTPAALAFFEVEMFHGGGRGLIHHDFRYDEGAFKAGIPFTTTMDAFFARGGIAFKEVFGPIDGGWIAPFIGFEYPRISVSIHQPDARQTTGEQYKQLIPYPIVGLAASFDLDPALRLDLRAFAGYLPTVPTPFTEGGRLSTSIETFNVEAELRWRLTPNIALTAGAGYQFWHGTLTSHEDGNDLRLLSPQVTAGLEIRW